MQPSSSYGDGDDGRDGILLPGYDYGGGGDNNNNNKNVISPFHVESSSPFSIDDGDGDEEDENGRQQSDYSNYVYDHDHDVENTDHNRNRGLLGRARDNYSDTSSPPLHEDGSRQQRQQQQPCNRKKANKIPPNYICPLSLKLMSDPMNDNCGHTFDRQAIFDWIDYTTAKNDRRNRRQFLGYSLANTTGAGGCCSVCPISRRPMDKADLFHNGRLKAQIEEWKDRYDHPDGYDYDHEDEEDEDHVNVNVKPDMSLLDIENERHSHSQFELMLLPQERSVLNIVKMRARTRQERRKFSRCMWCIGISVTLVVVAATIVALKFFNVRLSGPL
mmetsp:Transcript_45766/g.111590  ORF Transcript_45766/g.111590 Transcript_45766/m.111590 type:complete len:331 (+) Transcript_45766:167-1159(+)